MKRRFIVIVLFLILVCSTIVSCGAENSNESSSENKQTESEDHNIPESPVIDTDAEGNKRWRHGDHYHTLKEDDEPKLENDTIIKNYLSETETDIDCVLEKLNIDDTFLDLSLLDFANVLGLEIFDIEYILETCLKK